MHAIIETCKVHAQLIALVKDDRAGDSALMKAAAAFEDGTLDRLQASVLFDGCHSDSVDSTAAGEREPSQAMTLKYAVDLDSTIGLASCVAQVHVIREGLGVVGAVLLAPLLPHQRASLPLLRVLRRAPVLGDAVVAAVLPALLVAGIGVGFTETPQTQNGLAFLDFQRAVAFLPVFYFGVTSVTPERLAALKSKTAVALGWFGTVGAALAFVAAIRGASSEDDSNGSFGGYGYYCFDEIQRYLWMTSGYDYGGSSTHPSAAPLAHAAYRVAFYVSASAVTFAFAAIVPAEQRWYTSYGSRTMYAYLLHLILVRGLALAQDLWVPESAQPPLWAQALINFVVLPLAGSVGLMAPWCERAFKWLVEPAKVFGGTWFWRDFWEEEVH